MDFTACRGAHCGPLSLIFYRDRDREPRTLPIFDEKLHPLTVSPLYVNSATEKINKRAVGNEPSAALTTSTGTNYQLID